MAPSLLSSYLCLILSFSLFSTVLTFPRHHVHRALHEKRDHLKEASESRPPETCPNLPPPFDYSIKTRGQETLAKSCSIVPPTHLLAKRDNTCDENTPCSNGACCAKTGNCGYGLDYCGDRITPNEICWSNCNAFAECGKDAEVVNATCALQVCCSQYGFCGTTTDFCENDCQSNCEMPTSSGSTNGDVQSRIVGYYESWQYWSSCSAINPQLDNVPVGSLTHLVVSFGYITPSTYEITPMPGTDINGDILTQILTMKSQNPNVKMMISLGGWSFTDNGTDTQPVYSDMVSTTAKRAKFIDNLFSFLMQYGFDGVDFDWEYPGAGDRGGSPDDGENYALLLAEISVKKYETGLDYVVSCTTPSSYYYLQNFDLFTMMAYVDFTNLMSYDLHGTWDGPKDQIGSIILAHTNLTEIEEALDLFWRVGVDPSKINLGVGFYGRSFQLSDSSCWQPGCPFKGGATAGTCTQSSGILSFNEITQIITKYDITPYWDTGAAVKYITWDNDQWVSYDDQDTFQQKIKWANSQGLGGLSIWAIDQDTSDLQAMQGLLYPKTLNAFFDNTTDSTYWQQVQSGQCHLSDCNGSCNSGEVVIVTQPCDDAYGKQGTSKLCCPVTSAPDPSTCTWRGNPKYCNGRCHANEVAMEQNPWGDGSRCKDGNKVYCCEVPAGKETGCRQTGCGGSCNSDEVSVAGEFYDNCVLEPMQICCPSDTTFGPDTCHWQGKPGSCYDNVCAFNTEIELTASYDGGGETCGIQLSRDRVFCCETPDGEQPFLPVPLEYLFKNPPTGDGVDAKFKLSVDDTWGGGEQALGDDEPNDAAFGFFVMASPVEIQTSIDKRDGSHWEVFDCNNEVSEEEQTVRMFCNDDSENTNCNKIYLGYGVPGTILEMPKGCGPGRYAVAIDLQPSANQSIPSHITKRTTNPDPIIFDLKFDYDFRRVPRDTDLGTTQWRLDYSNEEGYWNKVVDSPGQTRRKGKRSLKEFDGNHKRYLEESWAEDLRDHEAGLITRAELHERWFGNSVVEWLKGLFTVVATPPAITHSIAEAINIVLLDETYQCNIDGVDVAASLLVEAQMNAVIDTSFGFTIVANLGLPPDLSQSYLYFKNSGTITALFTIDALVSASYDTGDIELFGLENFGATFSVPGILTVGPNFRLFGSVNMDLTLSGKFQAETVLAKWDTQLAFPDQSSTEDPQDLENPSQDGTQDVGTTKIDYSIAANGQITAHIKPMVSFGIEFNQKFISIDPATVSLVADGYVQLYASATYSPATTEVCYGANAGADLYAQLSVPSSIGWLLPGGVSQYSLYSLPAVGIIERTCPISSRDLSELDYLNSTAYLELPEDVATRYSPALSKRSTTVGPLIHIPQLSCPSSEGDETGSSNISTCPLCLDEDDDELNLYPRGFADLRSRADSCLLPSSYGDPMEDSCSPSSLSARSWYDDWDGTGNQTHILQPRFDPKDISITLGGTQYTIDLGTYPACGEASGRSNVAKYYTYPLQKNPCTADISRVSKSQLDSISSFQTDHVYEAQTLQRFFNWLATATAPHYQMPSTIWIAEVLLGDDQNSGFGAFDLTGTNAATPNGQALNLGIPAGGSDVAEILGYGFGRSTGQLPVARTEVNLALISGLINGAKKIWFGGGAPSLTGTGNDGNGPMNPTQAKVGVRYGSGMFQFLKYAPAGAGTSAVDEAIWNKWMRVSNWIDLVFYVFDNEYQWGQGRPGEPVNTQPGGIASMRSLYAYWIDLELRSIESVATQWSKDAQTEYENRWLPDDQQSGKNWFTATWALGGMATAAQMTFPQPATGDVNNKYGAYGYTPMTLDRNSNQVDIGSPTRI